MAEQETMRVGPLAPALCECDLPGGIVIDDFGTEIAPALGMVQLHIAQAGC